jgi:hypothetical protein
MNKYLNKRQEKMLSIVIILTAAISMLYFCYDFNVFNPLGGFPRLGELLAAIGIIGVVYFIYDLFFKGLE